MSRNSLQFQRRGRSVRIGEFSPRTTLLDWLRLQERSIGTKEGCAEGDCGACAVVVVRERDGRLVYEPVNSCITLLGQLDGAELITVEDLADEGVLHPVQEAMARDHGSQCGFCTPGIVMSLFAHYHECNGATTRDKINDALVGNLCRCTRDNGRTGSSRCRACKSHIADRDRGPWLPAPDATRPRRPDPRR